MVLPTLCPAETQRLPVALRCTGEQSRPGGCVFPDHCPHTQHSQRRGRPAGSGRSELEGTVVTQSFLVERKVTLLNGRAAATRCWLISFNKVDFLKIKFFILR